MSDKGTILGHLSPIQHDADGVEYSNATSGLTATNVQTAIDEVSAKAITNIDGGAAATTYGGISASPLDGGSA